MTDIIISYSPGIQDIINADILAASPEMTDEEFISLAATKEQFLTSRASIVTAQAEYQAQADIVNQKRWDMMREEDTLRTLMDNVNVITESTTAKEQIFMAACDVIATKYGLTVPLIAVSANSPHKMLPLQIS